MLHSEQLHRLYLNIFRMIKSIRLRWAGHVARMEEGRSPLTTLTSKTTGKDLYEGLGIDGRTVLE